MDRDEILRRSRAEKEDEGNTFLENKGRRWGMIGFCVMTIVLLMFWMFSVICILFFGAELNEYFAGEKKGTSDQGSSHQTS